MAAREDRLITRSASWDAFFETLTALPKKLQGDAFERLTQLYLRTHPDYQSKLKHVWRLSEVPANTRTELRLPRLDEGIDLIAETRDGEFWAVQCKFRTNRLHRLTRRELSTFTSLAFHTCQNISYALVAHTCSRPVSKHDLLPNTGEIGLARWLDLESDDWRRITSSAKGKQTKIAPRSPRPHQKEAIKAAQAHFIKGRARRGRLIMPCGTGKSLTAFWIAQALTARTTLVAVPSLALIQQSLKDWTREYLAHGTVPDWLIVCSDADTGDLSKDEFVGSTYELGIKPTTDAAEIADFLSKKSTRPRVVFSTYQSAKKLAAAARRTEIAFDLGILDEAHKTVGAKSKSFAALLFDKNVPIRRRLFMTATERILRGRNDDVLSMDDPDTYGEEFYLLSFKRAIKDRLISDYRILTIAISDERIRQLVEANRLLNLGYGDADLTGAKAVAAGVALKQAVKKHGITHAISFHRSIQRASDFAKQQDALNGVKSLGPKVDNLHISSKKSAGERADLLREFVATKRALLTNARCLTEGVDVPAIDCVLFADPKQSVTDIVQAAGRALRRHEGKGFGYILLPLVVPSDMTFEDFAGTTDFKRVAKTITALSVQDERIAEEFRALDRGAKRSGTIIDIEGDVLLGMQVDAREFAVAVSTRIWRRVAKANWRCFSDARAYVHGLGLSSHKDWVEFAPSARRPADIPTNPSYSYRHSGWISWGDWLGTGTIASANLVFRPFGEARQFARSLHLKNSTKWFEFAKSDRCPPDIPHNPSSTYKDAGWISFGDWLGTGRVAYGHMKYRSFPQARAFVRKLGLRNFSEWTDFAKSQRRPANIPARPDYVYRESGWAGMGDWLGTGNLSNVKKTFRSFKSARAYARSLGFSSSREWNNYAQSSRRPIDIPSSPFHAYRGRGWAGMGDWLGTGTVAPQMKKFRSFREARKFARSLGLQNFDEWRQFAKSNKRPTDIPSNPQQAYSGAGWSSMGDWLGTGTVSNRRRKFLPFRKARAFVRSLKFRNAAEWYEFSKSGKRPSNVPGNPRKVYANNGWAGLGDWLGTGNVANFNKVYRSFTKARSHARSLRLTSEKAWRIYAKGEKRPDDIPASPSAVYRDHGWTGWGDWLGNGQRRRAVPRRHK